MRALTHQGGTLALLVLGLLAFSPGMEAQQAGPAESGDVSAGKPAEKPAEPEERRVRRLGDVAPEDFELDLTVPVAAQGDSPPQDQLDLPDPEENEALQKILGRLASRPEDPAALAELDELLSGVLARAQQHADEGRLGEMEHLLLVVRNVNPRLSGLDSALRRLENLRNVDAWLAAADVAMQAGALIEPRENNALYHYRKVAAVDPGNEAARLGLIRVQQGLIARALDAAREFDFELANDWLLEASEAREPQDLVEEAIGQIEGFRQTHARRIEQDVLDAIVRRDFNYAEFVLIDLIALGGHEDRVERLRARLAEARTYGDHNPGDVIYDMFPDGEHSAPPVVVIAAGSFLMGSPENESGRKDAEGPQHRVTITRGFALGQHEVTVDEFRLFIESSGFHTQAELKGRSSVYEDQSGRMADRDDVNWRHDYQGRRADGDEPVLHVDWYDAQAYVEWLSERTGQSYRLPTEAEFEYAIRAGSVTAYWWGNGAPTEVVENLTGTGDTSRSGRNWNTGFEDYNDRHWGPAPAGSFQPNPFGLQDMAGNVSEWVMDCWHDTYTRAPADGSAWVNPGCTRRVVRGGYWASAPRAARSASRLSAGARSHGAAVGFRVARDL